MTCAVGLAMLDPAAGQCASRLDRATGQAGGACVYVGDACGRQAVAAFAADGRAVVVKLQLSPTLPPVFIAAQASSANEGRLVHWRPSLDLAAEASIGRVRLDDEGRTLTVHIDAGSLSANGCVVRTFVGRLAGTVVGHARHPY